MTEFKDKLKTRRKQLKLTGPEIALFIGVSKPTIYEWEKGKSRPSGGNLTKLSQILKVTPDSLINDETELSCLDEEQKSGPPLLSNYWQVAEWADSGQAQGAATYCGRRASAIKKGEAVVRVQDEFGGEVTDSYIVIEPASTLKPGEKGFFILDGHIVLGRYIEHAGDRWVQFIDRKRELKTTDRILARHCDQLSWIEFD